MSTSLVEQISLRLGIDEVGAQSALDTFAQQISELLGTSEVVSIEGLGTFQDVDGVITFVPTDEMIDAVNHRYAGLETIDVARSGIGPTIGPHDTSRHLDTDRRDDSETSPLIGQDSDDENSESPYATEPIGVVGAESDNAFASDGDRVPDPELETVDYEQRSDVPAAATELDEPEFSSHVYEVESPDTDLAGREQELGGYVETPQFARPDDIDKPATDVVQSAAVIDPSSKTLVSPPRKPAKRNTAAMVRMFVPLVAILVLVAVLMWLVSRPAGETSLSGSESSQMEDESTPSLGAIEDPVSPADVTTAEQTPPQEVTPPVPEWTDGQIDRTTGAYTIVVSSEQTRAEAEIIARSIALRLNSKTDVFVHTANSQTRYRVGVGQYETSDEAASSLTELSDELPEGSWVLRILPSM